MLRQIVLGSVLILATSVVHSVVTVVLLRTLPTLHADHLLLRTLPARIGLVAGVALILFLTTFVEVTIWAGSYLSVGAIEGFEPALYFSMVTFTTLGYGDIVLDGTWRLLASFQAALGVIMFGWTTALIVALIQRITKLVRGSGITGD